MFKDKIVRKEREEEDLSKSRIIES